MQEGWIKLHRQITNNPLWLSEPFTRAQAWVDLLLIANHADGFIRRRGIKINVKRGQVGMSQDSLADRWGWSKNKVRRFLKELMRESQIEVKTELKNIAVSTLISITNYGEYQGNDTENGTKEKPKKVPKTALEQECKEEKNKNLSSSSDEANGGYYLSRKKRRLTGKRLETFEQFWQAFGYKTGKAEAADAWMEIPALTDIIVSRIIKSAHKERERRSELVKQGKTPKMAQGWLSGRRWEDDDALLFDEKPGALRGAN